MDEIFKIHYNILYKTFNLDLVILEMYCLLLPKDNLGLSVAEYVTQFPKKKTLIIYLSLPLTITNDETYLKRVREINTTKNSQFICQRGSLGLMLYDISLKEDRDTPTDSIPQFKV